eukprot:7386055-Prymnesium_polylepis.2
MCRDSERTRGPRHTGAARTRAAFHRRCAPPLPARAAAQADRGKDGRTPAVQGGRREARAQGAVHAGPCDAWRDRRYAEGAPAVRARAQTPPAFPAEPGPQPDRRLPQPITTGD